ncbi:hypothetical protein ECE50_024895 [Chitinophaga sp. Mgbs1]|uniref:Uncharacterized protein n=1 Tax=Chitinophaga solisilvae TaxID=1233460 RepID=A0A3S1CVR2_9BACT|nr:hypothetical protein [Chitinophaga solisilvae]
MKAIASIILIYALLWTVPALAQKDTITVTGTRFVFPLVQQWINSYTRQHPEVIFRLVSPRDPAAREALVHISAQKTNEAQRSEDNYYIEVARYALLPVANIKSSYAGKPLPEKELRALYFDREPASQPLTVYNRKEKSCAPVTFAAFYGAAFEDIKGKQVPGDDQQLLKAVQEDPSAVSFNNPGFIYDLSSRLPVHDIAVIPLDLNNNGRLDTDENFYGNLDQLIQRLETAPPAGIPLENVTLSYKRRLDTNHPALKDWVHYIQSAGRQQLHDFGFLQLPSRQTVLNKVL